MTLSNNQNNEEKSAQNGPTEETSTTQHTVVIGEKEIRYTATAGTLIVKEEAEGDEKRLRARPKRSPKANTRWR